MAISVDEAMASLNTWMLASGSELSPGVRDLLARTMSTGPDVQRLAAFPEIVIANINEFGEDARSLAADMATDLGSLNMFTLRNGRGEAISAWLRNVEGDAPAADPRFVLPV